MVAGVLEKETGPDDQVLHGRADPDLRGSGQGTYARPDVHADPGAVVASILDLTDVKARTDLDPSGFTRLHARLGHASRWRRAVAVTEVVVNGSGL
jgi:hypothetical protein